MKFAFKSPCVVLLHGEMGAGKTTFVKSVVGELLPNVNVTSPTFTIMNQYSDNIFHADLYRIKDTAELENTDFFEILHGENIFFIEWPFNNVDKSIYDGLNVKNIHIEVINESERKITVN